MSDHPRILVTGFSVFPGVAVNPTETLVRRLAADPPRSGGAFRAEVLLVEYGELTARLEAIAADFRPDIAIHFGVARECVGFRLEQLARNEIRAASPDNAGHQPASVFICEGGEPHPATLPLDRILDALREAGLPVSLSDDAGGYLCNYLFYLSAGHRVPSFTPRMAGFVHVPPLREEIADYPGAMSLSDLERGARLIVATCAEAWWARGAGG